MPEGQGLPSLEGLGGIELMDTVENRGWGQGWWDWAEVQFGKMERSGDEQ